MNTIESTPAQQLKELQRTLQVIQRDQPDRLLQAIASRKVVDEVAHHILATQPSKKADQIHFNKIIQPEILSWQIAYRNLQKTYTEEPVLAEEQGLYYNKVLRQFADGMSENRELIAYCRSGETHLDEVYFLERYDASILPHDSAIYQWATYLALQRASHIIKQELTRQAQDGQCILRWTASKTNLIELLYALHASGVFNEGKADLKQIASEFERLFSTSLGNYYRVFQDIRQRKINQTVFLDQLKEKFMQRVNALE
jgi:hypothetical protein